MYYTTEYLDLIVSSCYDNITSGLFHSNLVLWQIVKSSTMKEDQRY